MTKAPRLRDAGDLCQISSILGELGLEEGWAPALEMCRPSLCTHSPGKVCLTEASLRRWRPQGVVGMHPSLLQLV